MSTSENASIASAHPDVFDEQAVVDHAYECLRVMRERAIYLKSLGYLGGNIHADTGLTPEMAAADDARKQRRIDALAEPATALCFGRIDRADGERFYVGRRFVEDSNGDEVVTDWRAPVAVPFYRATVADRMGLVGRRRFVIEGRHLLDIFEEDLDRPDAGSVGAYVPDPLLAEVERARTGTMRDIVATIQAEQDAIIRAPLNECIVVQGGPGTGKTAVGLHRVAFLLYTHREQLERERVLILGPNKIFFRYISQVLPSLGETAGIQLTVEGLAARYWVRAEDRPEVAALKGDARMATVVSNAALARIRPPKDAVTVVTAFGTVRLDPDGVAGIIKRALASPQPLNSGRTFLREQLVELAWKTYLDKPASNPTVWATFCDSVRSSAEFKKALDKAWPAMSAPDLVRRLYGNRRFRERAGDGILDPGERDLLERKPASKVGAEPWTRPDLALLDEAEALLNGTAQQYGHIIVDEAQDLSTMELRMVARRARRGSLTILGDLAQSAAAGGQTAWADAIDVLDAPDARYVELTVGYRVPAPILEFANLLLPEVAPSLKPTSSARTHGEPPRVVRREPTDLVASVAREAADLRDRWTSTVVVVPESLRAAVLAALDAGGLEFTDGLRTSELDEHLTVLTPPMTKGLEFDAVLAVEPSHIVAEHHQGTRLLYVVLTRAVQELVIVHAEPLPSALALAPAAKGLEPRS